MNKKDKFLELGMGAYILGDAFIYTISDLDLSVEQNRFLALDKICETQGWDQLGETWNSVSFSECSELLINSIGFSLAYPSSRMTPEKIAKEFHDNMLQEFIENDSYCYSNWFDNQWRTNNENGSGWIPLTENTFDLSTVFVHNDKILITCFIGED